MGDIKKILAELVAAQRETALATVVLAENVAALRQTLIELNGENMKVAERAAVAIERAADDQGEGLDS